MYIDKNYTLILGCVTDVAPQCVYPSTSAKTDYIRFGSFGHAHRKKFTDQNFSIRASLVLLDGSGCSNVNILSCGIYLCSMIDIAAKRTHKQSFNFI